MRLNIIRRLLRTEVVRWPAFCIHSTNCLTEPTSVAPELDQPSAYEKPECVPRSVRCVCVCSCCIDSYHRPYTDTAVDLDHVQNHPRVTRVRFSSRSYRMRGVGRTPRYMQPGGAKSQKRRFSCDYCRVMRPKIHSRCARSVPLPHRCVGGSSSGI